MSVLPVKVTPTTITDDLSAGSAAAAPVDQRELISKEDLKLLLQRSDAKGFLRLCYHLLVMGLSGTVYGWLVLAMPTGAWWSSWLLAMPALLLYGFTLASMFACLHETVHRTAFRSTLLNDGVAWFAGVLSFYNSSFYRHFHGWHHRFTQIPGKDPELEDTKPTTVWEYIVEISAVHWWRGKIRTHLHVAFGDLSVFPYIPEKARSDVARSVQMQLAVYVLLIALTITLMVLGVMMAPLFVLFWLLPLMLGQPFLRMLVLAEHTGCSLDANAMTNTRTTYTLPLVRMLMWEMPYHVEHHRYPALPFHALAAMHERLKPHITHLERGYRAAQRTIIAGFPKDSSKVQA